MKNERLLGALEALELYRRAASIVVNAFVDNLAAREDARHHQWRRPVPLQAQSARCGWPASLASRTFVAGYVGMHGMAHGLTTLLDAARIVAADPALGHVCFLFLGDGAEKAKLVALAKEQSLDNVLFLDTVPRDEVAAYWSLLDVSVIH